MDTLVQILIGVAVSVGLFLIGYRQTIGARRERVHAANSVIESILLRRIVLESYTPSLEDVSRFVEGKARDHRVRPPDLWSEPQILDTIVTRIIESDFITREQRNEILRRLSPLIVAAEEKPIEAFDMMEAAQPATRLFGVPALMAVLASILGVTLSLFFTRETFTWTILAVFAASLVIIIIIYTVFRIREDLEEVVSSAKTIETTIDFEREVARLIQEVGGKLALNAADKGFDFLVDLEGKRTLIEVKAWTGKSVPIHLLQQLAKRLYAAIEELKADQAIIVTKEGIDFPESTFTDSRIRVMSLRELRDYFVHGKR